MEPVTRGTCCSPKAERIASIAAAFMGVALVVMSVVLACGVFGYQGKFFLMAGSFMVGAIGFFCYSAFVNKLCQNFRKTT